MMQLKPSIWLGLFIITLIVFLTPENAFAASCPYCGKSYGAAAPGDRARVQALRRAHESSCSSRRRYTPQPPPGPSPAELERRRNKEKARVAYNTANKYNDHDASIEDLNKAINYYLEALSLYPNKTHYKNNMAIALSNKGDKYQFGPISERDIDMAIKCYKDALSYNSNDEGTKFRLRIAESDKLEEKGREYYKRKDYVSALRYYKQLREFDPWSSGVDQKIRDTEAKIEEEGQKARRVQRIDKLFSEMKAEAVSSKKSSPSIKRLKGIKDEDDKRNSYIRVAEARADAGDFAGAKATAARFIDTEFHWPFFMGDERSRAYQYIAEAQAKAGDIAGARETTARIISERDKSITYSAIAKSQAKAGDIIGARESIAQAREIAARIKSESLEKVRAYIGIAEEQAEAGDIAGARESIARAQESAARLKSESDRGWADRKIEESEEAVELKAHGNDEIEDWTELVGSFIGAFMGSSAKDDFQRFVEELKSKENNDDIAYDLAQAAVGYAEALNRVRNMEAKWQKHRAGETK